MPRIELVLNVDFDAAGKGSLRPNLSFGIEVGS